MTEARRLPGTLDALAALPEIVEASGDLAGLSTRDRAGLRLAIDELVTNAVLHGYLEAGREGVIDVEWHLDDDGRLHVSIEDDGSPFDPTELPDPDSINLPLQDRPVGGLGVMLVRRNVDDFRYEFTGRNRTMLMMVPRHVDPEA